MPTFARVMDARPRSIGRFRKVAIAEGVSFLVLLFIAMPMKYWGGMEWAVKVTGWVHGVLFIWYWVAAVPLFTVLKWPMERLIGLGAASVLPFGTFIMERAWLQGNGAGSAGLAGGTAREIRS